ncbi:hypothetical protein [Candidatus Hamiltonella defensa]|uniref:hypothetical protein n=1 Tax=Candidatus Williamhamiltonella defendens TaxID=138072 RepID=UPI001583D37E|nr:hypothetical protein [Candidatus Hamiltonella defensa]
MQTQTDRPLSRRKTKIGNTVEGRAKKKGGGVVLSVPKVLLHRHTRQYSLDNRMLYRVWLFRAKSHR